MCLISIIRSKIYNCLYVCVCVPAFSRYISSYSVHLLFDMYLLIVITYIIVCMCVCVSAFSRYISSYSAHRLITYNACILLQCASTETSMTVHLASYILRRVTVHLASDIILRVTVQGAAPKAYNHSLVISMHASKQASKVSKILGPYRDSGILFVV